MNASATAYPRQGLCDLCGRWDGSLNAGIGACCAEHSPAKPGTCLTPPCVLTPDLGQRLRLITAASLLLAQLGCRVVRQEVRQGSPQRPLLVLDRGSEAVRRELKSIVTRSLLGVRAITGEFHGVDVSWSLN